MKNLKPILICSLLFLVGNLKAQHDFHDATHTYKVLGNALEVYLKAEFKIGNCGICNYFDTAYISVEDEYIYVDARYNIAQAAQFCGCTDYDTLSYQPLPQGNYTLVVNSTVYHYDENGGLDTTQVDSDSSHVEMGVSSFPLYEDQAIWNVWGTENFWGAQPQDKVVQYIKDTALCGKEYSVSRFKIHHGQKQDSTFYVRNDGLKTYIRNSTNCNDEDYLMYDFGLDVFDTCIVYNEGLRKRRKMTVTLVDTIDWWGQSLKTIRLKYIEGEPPIQEVYTVIWIEGVGTLVHPFYNVMLLEDHNESFYDLKCLETYGEVVFQNPGYTNCVTTVGLEKLEKENEVVIYPVPSTDKVFISSSNPINSLTVYTVSGKVIISTVGDVSEIDISALPKGIYFLELELDGELLRKKIIKE